MTTHFDLAGFFLLHFKIVSNLIQQAQDLNQNEKLAIITKGKMSEFEINLSPYFVYIYISLSNKLAIITKGKLSEFEINLSPYFCLHLRHFSLSLFTKKNKKQEEIYSLVGRTLQKVRLAYVHASQGHYVEVAQPRLDRFG